MKKTTSYLLKVSLFLLFLLSFSNVVKAQDLNLEQKGKIVVKTIDIKTEELLSGIYVELIKTSDVNSEYEFVLTSDFAKATINETDEKAIAEKLAIYAQDNSINGINSISKEGKVIFTDLDLGEYLVIIKNQSGIEIANPFLVKLPQKNADNYIYSLIATPKINSQSSGKDLLTPPLTSNKEFYIVLLYITGLVLVSGGILFKKYEKK